MSRQPQTQANLEKARSVRAQGFKTGIHADPELRAFIDGALAEGGKTVPTIYKLAANTFKRKIPSLRAVQNYVERYYEPQTQVVVANAAEVYSTDYVKSMKAFDAYLNLVEAAAEAKLRYHEAKKIEPAGIGVKGLRSTVWFDRWSLLSQRVIEKEIELKVRFGSHLPEGSTFINDNSVHNTQINLGDVADVRTDDDRLASIRARLDARRGSVIEARPEPSLP